MLELGAASAAHILIIRAGALGDTILTIPALQAVRDRFPKARITVVGYPETWTIAGRLVNEVIPIDARLFAELYAEPPCIELPEALRDIDLVIAWTIRDPAKALAEADIPVIHATPYPQPGVHAASWLLKTLGLPGVLPATLDLRRVMGLPALAVNRKLVFIHPGAGATWKRWSAERFTRVADVLIEQGYRIQVIEGPADEPAVEELLREAEHPLPVVRKRSVRALAETLLTGILYIGNDTGVTHLAAGLGLQTIAVFGPTDPAQWRPIGNVAVLRRCDRVAHAQGMIRVCDDPSCIDAVSVEEVLGTVSRMTPPH